MDRKSFLKQLGIGAGAVVALSCLGACSRETPTAQALAQVDFTVDLNEPDAKTLQTPGGFIIRNQVVIARTNTGSFVAVTQVCSHEGQLQVRYLPAEQKFRCSAHGAEFNLQGTGLNANGSKGLKTYNTTINGNILRVFS